MRAGLILLLACLATPLGAQFQQGTRIRVEAPSILRKKLIGDFMGVKSDTMLVGVRSIGSRPDTTASMVHVFVPTAAIRSIDVRMPGSVESSMERGAKTGLITGLIVSTVFVSFVALTEEDDPPKANNPMCGTRGGKVACAALQGGVLTVVGTVFGMVVGVATRPERWVRMEVRW